MSAIPPVTQRRIPLWIKVVLVLVSACLGMTLWNRPAVPVWMDGPGGAFTNPIGITEDGRVLYLSSSTQLIVRDVATGHILAEHRLNQPCSTGSGMLTRDGERIVLATDGPSKSYCTISTRDGRQLFPLLVANTTAASALSADGRYLMVSSVGTGTSMTYQTFDLETGTPVWSCSEETVFSRNGRTAYSLVRAGENTSLVIRSMDDGRELNRVEIPKVEGRRLSGIGTQRNERVYFSFESNDTSPDSVMIADADIWSGRVEGNILTDFRREPMNYHRQVNAGLNVIRVNEETICYELQQRDLYKSAEGRNWLKFLEWASHFRLVTRYSSQTYAWQQVSPVTGWHTGSPIPMEIPIFTIAPDGKWIVTGGQNVAAYAIPVGSNLIEILAAVLLPWGLAWLVCYWRNRTAGRTTDAVPHPHQPLEELK